VQLSRGWPANLGDAAGRSTAAAEASAPTPRRKGPGASSLLCCRSATGRLQVLSTLNAFDPQVGFTGSGQRSGLIQAHWHSRSDAWSSREQSVSHSCHVAGYVAPGHNCQTCSKDSSCKWPDCLRFPECGLVREWPAQAPAQCFHAVWIWPRISLKGAGFPGGLLPLVLAA